MFFEVNREFNLVLRPVSNAYKFIVPKPIRFGIHNFFANTFLVPTMVNDLLQANRHYFGHDLARFLINSTIGLFGIFDVASKVGIYPHPQGFGYTLSKWGLTPSPYVVMPLLGPSTMTSALGFGVDLAFDPLTYYNYQPWWTMFPVRGLQIIDIASRELPKEELLTQTALDPYVAVRNAYLQNRAHNMLYIQYDGEPPESVLSAGTQPGVDEDLSPALQTQDSDVSPAMLNQEDTLDATQIKEDSPDGDTLPKERLQNPYSDPPKESAPQFGIG